MIPEVANLQGQGSRAEQQDAFGLSLLSEYEEKGLLAVLCDGMGGMDDGREIAQLCVQKILAEFPLPADPEAIAAFDETLTRISDDIYEQHEGRGGSTLVLAYIRNGKLWFKCMGDSDFFLIRYDSVYALNRHQTFGIDQLRLSIDTGMEAESSLTGPQAGALTGFMGCSVPSVEGNTTPLPLEDGDILLLCSDGVSGTLSRRTLLEDLKEDIQAGAARIDEQVQAAAKPNQDNYTAIICKYNA